MSGRNDLIDGWRGVSVTLVIIGHLLFYRLGEGGGILPLREVFVQHSGDLFMIAKSLAFRFAAYAQSLAILGVNVFFLISGFLITSLLLSEEKQNGSVSILAFYVRRICRILPPLYFFLATIVILGSFGLLKLPDGAALRSGLFVCNVHAIPCSWWFGHTWSLAVEEQFYLLWPALFLLPLVTRKIVIGLLAVSLPIIAHFWIPLLESFIYITVGAVVASFGRVHEIIGRLAATPLMLISIGTILAVPLMGQFMPQVQAVLLVALPALLALVVFGAASGHGPMTRIISSRAMQKIGVVSYSLYLWQQLSLAPLQWHGMNTGADLILRESVFLIGLFIIPAFVSYYFLEQPLIALGRRKSREIIEKRRHFRHAKATGSI